MIKFFKEIMVDIKKISEDPKKIKQFGWLSGISFLLIGYFIFRKLFLKIFLLSLSLILLFCTIFWVKALKRIYKIWSVLFSVLGFFFTQLVLMLFYYLVITPIGFFLRWSGHDLLNCQWDPKSQSYWVSRKSFFDKNSYEKQF